MPKITPTDDRVLLKGISNIQATVSGLVIPAGVSKDRPEKAEVLAIGPGYLKKDGSRIPLDVKVGDVVYISKYAAEIITIEEEEHYIIRENSILAIINS